VGRTELSTDVLQGVHVLLVDDDQDSLEILRTIVRYFGALTTEAPSADSALAILGRVIPDVAVIDLLMPGHDGLFLVRRIRSMPMMAGVRGLALTGHADIHPRTVALAAGFDAYLREPVDPVALCRTLVDLAAPRSGDRAAPDRG
jgi:CheY-like chemotaxis protein